MPLAPVSQPFDYLIDQIQRDLYHAAELCRIITKNRHVSNTHKELDALEQSLGTGPGAIRVLANTARTLPGIDADGGDGIPPFSCPPSFQAKLELFSNDSPDISRQEVRCFAQSVEEIEAKLDSIAYPRTRHAERSSSRHAHFFRFEFEHDHDHYHDRGHRHIDVEVAHFHELLLKWEGVRDGLSQAFSDLSYRLTKAREKKDKDKEDKKKADDEKAKEKKKVEDEKKKAADKAAKELEEAEKKAKEAQEALETKLAKHEKREEDKLEHVNEMEQKRDKHVDQLLQNKLEDDPIRGMERLTGVIGKIQDTFAGAPARGRSLGPPIDDLNALVGVVGRIQNQENISARRSAPTILTAFAEADSHSNSHMNSRNDNIDRNISGSHHEDNWWGHCPVCLHEHWAHDAHYGSHYDRDHHDHDDRRVWHNNQEPEHHHPEVVINNSTNTGRTGEIETIEMDDDGSIAETIDTWTTTGTGSERRGQRRVVGMGVPRRLALHPAGNGNGRHTVHPWEQPERLRWHGQEGLWVPVRSAAGRYVID
jgi:hypothetical protein